MKKTILALVFLLLIAAGCEYASELPESICVTASNLTMYNNGSQVHIENGQVEVQIGSCDPINNQSIGGEDSFH